MKKCWVCGQVIDEAEVQCLKCLKELADSFMEEQQREVVFYEVHPETDYEEGS